MDDPRSVPAVKFTSCHFFDKTDKTDSTTEAPFACGAIIHPFHQYSLEHENITHRPPILCISCGGFLSIHAVINPISGEWCCPLCRNTNPRFHGNVNNSDRNYDQYLREIYPELQSKHCDFHEIQQNSNIAVSSYSELYTNILNPLHVFVIDRSLLDAENKAIDMLYKGLRQIPRPNITKICVILLGRDTLHLVRLSSIESDPILAMDALPGNEASGANIDVYGHYIARGMYSTTVSMVVDSFEILRAALQNMHTKPSQQARSSSGGGTQGTNCTINTVVSTSLAMLSLPVHNTSNVSKVDTSSLDNRSVKLMLLTGSLLPIVSSPHTVAPSSTNPLTSVTVNLSSATSARNKLQHAYHHLGRHAYHNNLSIDVFYSTQGLRDYSHTVDKFKSLVECSGGEVVRFDSCKEEQVVASFTKLLKGGNDSAYHIDTRAAKMATIEVHTCGELSVDQIVGGVVAVEDTLYHRNNNGRGNKNASNSSNGEKGEGDKILSAHQITVDKNQLVYTLNTIDSQSANVNNANTTLLSDKSDAIYSKLMQVNDNQNTTVISGLSCSSQNYTSDTMLSLIFNHYETTGGTSPRNTISTSQAISKLLQNNPITKTLVNTTGATLPQYNDNSSSFDDKWVDYFGTTPTEKESYLKGIFVQFVIRYEQFNFAPSINTPNTSGKYTNRSTLNNTNSNNTIITSISKVTRVVTIRLDRTTDYSEYLHGIDAPLYGLVSARGLVADYHSECMETFGGVRRSKLDEQGNYQFSHLLANAFLSVDKEVANIAAGMTREDSGASYKAMTVCRMLHHLREGPLLDGPSMQPVEAYLLRSLFLKAPYIHAMRLVLPSLKLVYLNEQQQEEVQTIVVDSSSSSVTLTTLLPPPSNLPPPTTVFFPPPNSPPPNALPNALSALTLQPPSTPHPSTLPPSTQKAPAGTSTPVVDNSNSGSSLILHIAPPESMSLLPHTVALIDYGDEIIVKLNPGGDGERVDDEDEEVHNERNRAKQERQYNVAKQLAVIAHRIAATRYPVSRVQIITSSYSPLNRLVYSRLSPNHMDHKHNLLLFYSLKGRTAEPATPRTPSNPLPACDLTEEEIEHMISVAPITEQTFLSQYLQTVVKTEGAVSAILASSEGDSETVYVRNEVTAFNSTGSGKMIAPVSGRSGAVPPQSLSMERGGEVSVQHVTDKLQQVSLTPPPASVTDDTGFALHESIIQSQAALLSSGGDRRGSLRYEQQEDEVNNSTVWSDLTNVFSNIVTIGKSNKLKEVVDENKRDNLDNA